MYLVSSKCVRIIDSAANNEIWHSRHVGRSTSAPAFKGFLISLLPMRFWFTISTWLKCVNKEYDNNQLIPEVPVIAVAKGRVPRFPAPSVNTVLHAEISHMPWGNFFKFGSTSPLIQGWRGLILLFTHMPKACVNWFTIPPQLQILVLFAVAQNILRLDYVLFWVFVFSTLLADCMRILHGEILHQKWNALCMVELVRSTQRTKLAYPCHRNYISGSRK